MAFRFVRLVRTPSSERYMLSLNAVDAGVVDIHYLADLTVQATLVVFEGSGVTEDQVPELLTEIDETLLPDVQMDHRNLRFTVVFGQVLGAYEHDKAGGGS